MTSPNPHVFDVTDATFEKDVIEASRAVPVVVDFWAPWCGPCRVIGPLLEKLAAEGGGAWRLAKVNSDDNPMLARTFQITSIPTVLALRGGEIVSEFVGAQPEAFIRQFVKDLLPSEAELLALDGEKKRKAGRFDEAEKVFEEALQKDRDSSPALLGLARLRADQGRTADALSLLDQVPPGTAERAEAERLAARLRVQATAPVNTADLAERVKENPGDLESRSALGLALAAGGRYAEALEQFLEIVARDKGAGGENARKAVLDIFQILGPEHPVTVQYRSRLANLLFA